MHVITLVLGACQACKNYRSYMGVYARGDDCHRIVDRTVMNRRHALGLNTDEMCNSEAMGRG